MSLVLGEVVPVVCDPGVVLGVIVEFGVVVVVPVVLVPFTPVVVVALVQGVVVQPVVLFVVPGVLVVVEEAALPLGVVLTDGVPVAEVPVASIPLVEVPDIVPDSDDPGVVAVLGLVAGVAVPPDGTAAPVPTVFVAPTEPVCPTPVVEVPVCGVVPFKLPVAVDCEVWPAPAGSEAVLPIVEPFMVVVEPFMVVPVVAAPALPVCAPAPAAPAVWATPKAVQQSARVAVIRSFFISTRSPFCSLIWQLRV